ncbi:putative transposase [Paenibacillus larvae subsp. larvae DSM 25719]|nr:putative transposase [Paenibacillus larvae subsp. larvae DSM 25719]
MMLNAMLWVARSGAPWRDLPEHYGSWKTVYTRFRRWQMAGIWDEILKQVSVSPDLENIMIDATIVASISMGRAQKGAAISGHRTLQRRNNNQNSCHCRCTWNNSRV